MQHNLTILEIAKIHSPIDFLFRTVIDTLKTIAGGRKCFRLIGGVLCESTVATVLPQLSDSKGQLEKLIESMNEQLTKKGAEINQFREQHNIRFEGMPKEGSTASTETAKAAEDKPAKENRTVLVVNN